MRNTMSSLSNHRPTAAALVFFGFVFAPVQVSSQSTLLDIKTEGVLRGGIVSENSYPFVYQRNGSWDGYEISLMRAIAEELGVRFSLQVYDSRDELLAGLGKGDVHVAFSKFIRDLANSEVTFQTSPVASLNLVIVVNRTAYSRLSIWGDLSTDLARGSVPLAVMNEPMLVRRISYLYPRTELTMLDDKDDLWEQIERGSLVAVAFDEAAIYRYFAGSPQMGIQLRVFPLSAQVAVVGLVPWNDDFFWEWVNIFVEGQGNHALLSELTSTYNLGQ